MAPDRRYAEKLVRIEQRLRRDADRTAVTSEPAVPAHPARSWLTPSEVANQVRVSVASVLRAISSGYLEATRLGPRTLRIEQDAVDRWMASRRAAR